MNKNKNISAFSLLELSVVLVVLASVTAGILTIASDISESNAIKNTRERLEVIEDALARHVQEYGYLPCPARINSPENSLNFGVSTDCSIAAVSGIFEFNPGSSIDVVRIGSVPTRTLSLPDHMMHDPWNGRITYAVIRDLAIDSSNFASYSNPGAVNGVITIVDRDNNQMTASGSNGIVAYVIISHGKDREGSYSKSGALASNCSTTSKDDENCDFASSSPVINQIFRDSRLNDSVAVANYFYDIVRWKTYNIMSTYQ